MLYLGGHTDNTICLALLTEHTDKFSWKKKGKHPQTISHSKLAPNKDMGIFKYNRKLQYQELIRHSRQRKSNLPHLVPLRAGHLALQF